MRALADAKQMLVSGAVGSVELGCIVRRELELAGVSAERLAAIAGPEVQLDDEAAQALSLAVHEFVTNSIKYGALAGHGHLAVGWHRDDGEIELDWTESGLAETPRIDTERSEEHTSELQALMRISHAVFCLNKKTTHKQYAKHNN